VPWDWTDVGLFVAAAFVVAPVAVLVFGGIANLAAGGQSPELRTALHSFASATGVYVAWVAVVAGLVIWRRHGSLADLGWRTFRARWVALSIPLAAITLITAVWLGQISTRLLPGTSSGQCNAVRQEFGHILIVGVILVAVIDPLAEETIFRGFIYGWLRGRMPVAAAIGISAAIFGAAHFDLLLFLPLFGVGAILALVYELSGSLVVNAIVHGLFNAYNIMAILNAPTC